MLRSEEQKESIFKDEKILGRNDCVVCHKLAWYDPSECKNIECEAIYCKRCLNHDKCVACNS